MAEWNSPAAVRNYVDELSAIIQRMDMAAVSKLIELCGTAYTEGRTVFFAGNGGSAATASHFACDLGKTISGYEIGKRLRAISLTDNIPLLTAWGNDSEYDDVFSEQLRNLGSAGDTLIAISCSGNSGNVLRAVELANEMEMTTVGLTGFGGGRLAPMVDLPIVIESHNYQYVEDAHSIIMHIVTARMADGIASGALS